MQAAQAARTVQVRKGTANGAPAQVASRSTLTHKAVRGPGRKHGRQLAGGSSSWCPKLEFRTTQATTSPDHRSRGEELTVRRSRAAVT